MENLKRKNAFYVLWNVWCELDRKKIHFWWMKHREWKSILMSPNKYEHGISYSIFVTYTRRENYAHDVIVLIFHTENAWNKIPFIISYFSRKYIHFSSIPFLCLLCHSHIPITFWYLFIHQNPSSLLHSFFVLV